MRTENSSLLQETIELAQALIRIPSFNPPGNETAIASFASEWLKKAGVSSEFIPLEEGRCSLVARIPGTQSGSIVLCGHLDTVSADAAQWKHNPMNPIVRDGRLWGLGAADMKSAVAVLMQTLARQAVSSSPLDKSLVLVLTADEEWGYRGAATVARSGLIDDAELIVIAEPTANSVCKGQKGELWVEASFTGKEAHGSLPESGVNAILPAARFCLRLQTEIDSWKPDREVGRTTLNIGRVDGGRQVNIVPGETRIQLDIRVVSEMDYKRVIQILTALGEAEATESSCVFSFRVISYHPPVLSRMDHVVARRLIALSQTSAGNHVGPLLTPFSTDAVSIASKLHAPILICGPGHIAQAHQPDEFIALSQIEQYLTIMLALLS